MLEKQKQQELAEYIKKGQESKLYESMKQFITEVDELFIALLLGKLEKRNLVIDFCDGLDTDLLVKKCAKEFGISEINVIGLWDVKKMTSLSRLQEMLYLGYISGY